MTNTEYTALLKQAREQFPRITLRALREIKMAYSSAIETVTSQLSKAKGYSPITMSSLKGILEQLKKGVDTVENKLVLKGMIDDQLKASISNWDNVQKAITDKGQEIADKISLIVPDTIKKGSDIVQKINGKYLIDVINLSGGALSENGIMNMFSAVKDKLLTNIAGRIFQDGYSYSQRIWGIGNMFDEDVKRVLLTGIAENRDILDISKDLNVYVNEGYQKLMKRYGDLIRGTAAFRNRIRQKVYYPSLRLVRSELYAGLHDNAVYMARINPACTGWIKWVRNSTFPCKSSCPDNAHNSPYLIGNVPGYSHPNCLCTLEPVLMDRKQFVEDMKAWGNGENVPYIENWYNEYYSQFAEVAA